jgi:hypothetical protein
MTMNTPPTPTSAAVMRRAILPWFTVSILPHRRVLGELQDLVGAIDRKVETACVESQSISFGEIAGSGRCCSRDQDRSAYRDVEALDESAHGDAHASRASTRELASDPVSFVAEDDGDARNFREIGGRELTIGIRSDELVAPRSKRIDRFGWRRPSVKVDPFLRAARHGKRKKERLLSLDDVHVLNAERIARSNDRGAVVRIVRCVEDDLNAREPLCDHALQSLATPFEHERLEQTNHTLGIVRFHAGDPCGNEVGSGDDPLAVSPHAGARRSTAERRSRRNRMCFVPQTLGTGAQLGPEAADRYAPRPSS